MIQFRQSRAKLVFLFVVLTILTVVLAFMGFVSAYLPGLWCYLGLTLFAPVGLASAVAAVAAGMGLAKPATLTADASGVCFCTRRGEKRWRWEEIEAFEVFSSTGRLRSPGMKLRQGTLKFVSFGRCWEKSAEEIVGALGEQTPQ
jgi:hypothetical protein